MANDPTPLTYSRLCARLTGAIADLERHTPADKPTLRDDMQLMHTAWQSLYTVWAAIESKVRNTRLMAKIDGSPDVEPVITALVELMAQSAQFAVHLSTHPAVMDRTQAVSEGRRDIARMKVTLNISPSDDELDDLDEDEAA